MGKALYRKYRPRSFAQAVGQETITRTLEESLKTGRISHAYLFAGPRGVGKTSIARILAHAVNDLAYKGDGIHLDIIEIDAASNRRIDEIRDLRERVHIAPTSVKYKIYIIDEVHMLTKEAFNALLKTLEEPPAHCIFILATTEAHKMPETIISRTQRFNFKPIDRATIKKRLGKIAKAEKIAIEGAALDLLADHGDGSLRDIEGMLDQLSSSSQEITEADVRNLLGVPPQKAINELVDHVSYKEPPAALKTLEYLKEQGASPSVIAKNLATVLRQSLLEQRLSGAWVTDLLKDLLDVSASNHPQDVLELCVLAAASRDSNDQQTEHEPPSRIEKTLKKEESEPFSLHQWDELLAAVKVEAPSLYTALRLAEPTIKQERVTLAFPFPLHQKRVAEARHIQIIARLIEGLSGAKVVINCVVDKELANQQRPEPIPVKTISNIFGSAEVLES